MLEQAAGLTSRVLQAIAELERRVVDADGVRLKLEWGRLRGRTGDWVEDLLWWEDDRLLGSSGSTVSVRHWSWRAWWRRTHAAAASHPRSWMLPSRSTASGATGMCC